MRRRTSIVAALFILVACGDGLPVSTRLVLNLRAAHARWERRGTDSYEITVRRVCFCGFVEPVRVKVVDGTIVSRTVVSTGDQVPTLYASQYPDIPGLFAIVEEAATEADKLHTEFDATYGFPTIISIDWIENAVDDEVGYVMEEFVALP
jgi:hypothetical protein